MPKTVLGLVHNATTLLFGVYISAAFLGIKMHRENILTMFIFSLCVGIFFVLSFVLFGERVTEQLYPLIIHLPLVLFLTLYYKYRAALSTLSVLTAYLCCQVSNWVGLAALDLSRKLWVYYCVRIIITAAVFLLLIRYVSSASARLLQKPTGSIMILALMPTVYYLYDYTTSVYTELLYSGMKVVTEFLGFVLCIAYVLFLFLYFKQYEGKCEVERKHQLIEMQHSHFEKELDTIRRSERELSIARHDMRHFLLNVSSFIENGEYDKAQKLIGEVTDAIAKTPTLRYCKNELVNMIIGSYAEKFRLVGCELECAVQIPEALPFSDVDLTAILSNGLENALQAVTPLPREKRFARIEMRMNGDKLLISVKNTFYEPPVFADGIPISQRQGHGIGTQSIVAVTEKLRGNSQFTANDGIFILRVIL